VAHDAVLARGECGPRERGGPLTPTAEGKPAIPCVLAAPSGRPDPRSSRWPGHAADNARAQPQVGKVRAKLPSHGFTLAFCHSMLVVSRPRLATERRGVEEIGGRPVRLGYDMRASLTMLRHPRQGAERIRGRMDRRRDLHELAALGMSQSDFYKVTEDWSRLLHEAIDAPWPCPDAAWYAKIWDSTISDLTAAGMRVGLASYSGWSDGDQAQAEAVWCLVAHLRPATVVETGVAHGVTTRVILDGLERNGSGHLWSIDLPAVDPALHREIGIAVPAGLRSRWTYVKGTSRERLPRVVRELQQLDLFIHDSLHTGRNLGFELGTAWPALRSGGGAVIDDIDHSLGFQRFTDRAAPAARVAARHVAGHGLWGVAIKGHAPGANTPT